VTAGIISAKGRDINRERQFQHFIQTDAAINPGNSGGPLLNIRGEAIGVNTMIATRTGGSDGVGFALPINMAVRVYNDIIRDGRVSRGSIGVTVHSKPETLKGLGVDHGVVVAGVERDGPAERAGVKPDDIILGIDGKPVKDGDDLVARVSDMPLNSQVTLNVDRDGKKLDLKATIRDRTEVFRNNPRVLRTGADPEPGKTEGTLDVKFGIGLRPLSDSERADIPDKRGIYVTRVEPDSFAQEIGMEEGDIITAINRQPVNSREDVLKVQTNLKPGDAVAFRVIRKVAEVTPGKRGQSQETETIFLSGYLPSK
jgi:serine protease Do